MRRVKQPGPEASQRSMLCPSRGRSLTLTLRAGCDLDTAVRDALTAERIDSAWLEIDDAPVDCLAYVIPDKAPNDKTVAWYSRPHRFEGSGQIDHLGMIVGQSEDTLFLHGHGWWAATGGAKKMGHILPQETFLSQDTMVRGLVFEDARFERLYDAETNFSLFQPVQTAPPKDTGFALLRILPNEDFTTALDAACASLGWQRAKARGLGSLVGAEFEGGATLDSFATELLILNADARANHGSRPGPEIAIVGEAGGGAMRGRLKQGENPILITAEIILEKTDI